MLRRNKSKHRSLNTNKRYTRSSHNYTNPFFKQKRSRKLPKVYSSILSFKQKIVIFLFFIFLLSGFYLVFYSQYFNIKIITGRGEGRLDPVNVEAIAWQQIHDSDFIFWPQKNIFIFNKQEFIKNLNLKFSFNEINVKKKLPNKIIIDYKEKEHSLIWLEKDIYYYIDNLGYIVERIGDNEVKKDYPLVKNISSLTMDANRVAVDKKFLVTIFSLLEKIKGKDFLVDYFLIDGNASSTSLSLQLQNGPKLIFATSRDLDKQLKKIYALKNDILQDDFFKKEYIDVRVGDRAYYR